MTVSVVGIGGSLRTDSQSERALRIALEGAERAGAKTTVITGADLVLPFYDPAVLTTHDNKSRTCIRSHPQDSGNMVHSPSGATFRPG